MPSRTEVSIRGDRFFINGEITCPGTRAEGLLLNSRMVQGIFDDLNPATRSRWDYPDGLWDAERNTGGFVAAMPSWREHGLLAFTINLQGGSPQGYSESQPWHNSAFDEAGALREDYTRRLARILDRADELGMVAILGLFYFGQDQRLRDERAVLDAVDHATRWVLDRGDRHVVIEIANECDIEYDHAIIQPDRVTELIERVRSHSDGRLPVGVSYSGGKVPTADVIAASDVILMHGNGVGEPGRIREMVRTVRAMEAYRGQPIVFNEDDHFDFDKPDNNMLAAISEGASWGYFDYRFEGEAYEEGYQSVPVDWMISSERKRRFFDACRRLSTA